MGAEREGIAEEKTKDISLKELSRRLHEFAKARSWEKFHTPRNLLLPKVGEVGEVSEIFEWRGEVDKEHLGEELGDILLYIIRLADIYGIDLGHVAINKMSKNAIKCHPKNIL